MIGSRRISETFLKKVAHKSKKTADDAQMMIMIPRIMCKKRHHTMPIGMYREICILLNSRLDPPRRTTCRAHGA